MNVEVFEHSEKYCVCATQNKTCISLRKMDIFCTGSKRRFLLPSLSFAVVLIVFTAKYLEHYTPLKAYTTYIFQQPVVRQSDSYTRFRYVSEESIQIMNSSVKAQTVFVVSQIRSGSTFLGEIFNQRANVSYFYEPLWQFPRNKIPNDGMAVLRSITECQLHNLPELYQNVFNSTEFLKNTFAR